jgi:hypothetical protein
MKAAIISEIGPPGRRGRIAGRGRRQGRRPKLTTADAKAFAGKMRQISSFSVYYFVIVNNHWGGNIEAPATKINGTVVPAGASLRLLEGRRRPAQAPGDGPGQRDRGREDHRHRRVRRRHLHHVHDAVQRGVPGGMVPLARQNHNEFINRYPPGLDATVWIVGNAKQTMSFRNDTKYPILITRTITQRRQQAMDHVQDLERAERPEATGHQHGHPAGPARDRHGREGSDQARGVPLPQQRPATAPRCGSPCRSTTTASSTGEALLLELPSRQRRPRSGDQDLTLACLARGGATSGR